MADAVYDNPEDLKIIEGFLLPDEEIEEIFDLTDPRERSRKKSLSLLAIASRRIICYSFPAQARYGRAYFLLSVLYSSVTSVALLVPDDLDARRVGLEIRTRESMHGHIGNSLASGILGMDNALFPDVDSARRARHLILTHVL
jgi:hypothetical protein